MSYLLKSQFGTFLVAQLLKNPPAMWETWVQSLGWENPLEKGKATHCSLLAWRIPRTEESDPIGQLSLTHSWDFLGGPVAKILHFQCRGPRFDPWSGN